MRLCGDCGSNYVFNFNNRDFEIEHGDCLFNVENLSGWECGACHSVWFSEESAKRYAKISDNAVKG